MEIVEKSLAMKRKSHFIEGCATLSGMGLIPEEKN
jgi:hypothetical protein